MNLPQNKYNIVYADPPWSYRDKASAGNRGASHKYSVMNLQDIKDMPIEDICEDDCVLFLWATFPMLQEALDTIEAWGFTYKTIGFSWVKLNKRKPTPFWGMGNWTRSNQEVCLIGTKGKPKRISASVHSVVMSPIRKHSQKPDEVRTRITDLVGDLPRIELFARSRHDGWDAWGNEVDGS